MFIARTEAELAQALVHRPMVCAALGTFDGVHLGHQALLRRAREIARAAGGVAIACTFDPHPKRVVRPQNAPPSLESLSRRLQRFAAMEMDGAFVIAFDEALASQPADQFAERLLARTIGAKAVVVGEGFRFGQRRAGDVALLRALGDKLAFAVHAMPAVQVDGQAVSSSRLRTLVAQGQLGDARRLLGRHVELSGVVVHGDARGRTLGYPTANVACEGDVLPPLGIYAGLAHTPQGEFASAISIGVHPTFVAAPTPKVEAYLIQYAGQSLYDERIVLTLLARLRGEEKFAGVEPLLAQMHRDVEQAEKIAEQARRERAVVGAAAAAFRPPGSAAEPPA